MKKSTKWILGIVGGLFLLIIIALAIPFLIDFSYVKPQVQGAVEANLNAKVDFESIRLQIIPGFGLKIKKFQVINTHPDFKDIKMFSVDEVFFQTEFLPMFAKKFVGELVIKEPEIVIARKGLKSNITSITKPSDKAEIPAEKPDQKTAEKKSEGLTDENVKMIKESFLLKRIEIINASLLIKDLASVENKEPVKITEFNFKVENIGLERDIPVTLSTKAVINQNGIKIDGPISVLLTPKVKVSAKGFEEAVFNGKVDLDQLDINAMNAFIKPKGTALNLMLKGRATPNTFTMEEFKFNLHTLSMGTVINISDLKSLQTDMKVILRNDNLASLGVLLPQHKNMLMNGSINMAAGVDGPLAEFKKVKADLKMVTKLTGSDLDVGFNLTSLEPINMSLKVNSKRFDVGALVKPFMPPPDAQKKEEAKVPPSAAPEAKPGAEPPAKDFELTPEQKILLANSNINVDVSFNEILYDKVKIENLILKLRQKSFVGQLEEFSLKALGGHVLAKGQVNLDASPIGFKGLFDLKSVRTEQILEIVAPEHKELVVGSVNVNMNTEGQGTTKPTLTKTLNGKGQFKFLEGEVHTGSVADLMQKEFNAMVGGISVVGSAENIFKEAEKLADNPLLKKIPGAKPFDVAQFKGKYDSFKNVNITNKATANKSLKDVAGTLEIKNGRIYLSMKNATPEGVYDFAGSVGLDLTLQGKTNFTASETLKAKLLTQSPYASLLFDANKKLDLNMDLGGTAALPTVKLDSAAIKERFSKNAKDLVEKEVKKAAEDQAKNALKGQKGAAAEQLNKKKDEILKDKGKQEQLKKDLKKSIFGK